MRVLDSATGEELLADRDYGQMSMASPSRRTAGWSRRALMAKCDGTGLTSNWRSSAPRPTASTLTVSRSTLPAGASLSATDDKRRVSILDAKIWRRSPRRRPAISASGNLANVAWSRDGATLVAGGTRRAIPGRVAPVSCADSMPGRRKGDDVPATSSTIYGYPALRRRFRFRHRRPVVRLPLRRRATPRFFRAPAPSTCAARSDSVRGLARCLLGALRARLGDAEARRLRSRRRVTNRFAKPSVRVCARASRASR